MVELEPSSCRICLSIPQSHERQLLLSEEGSLTHVGLLYEEVLSLPIACEGTILKYICNSCDLQLKLFKELKSKALETHLLLSDIYDMNDRYLIKNCTELEYNDDNKTDIIETIEEDENNEDVKEMTPIIEEEDNVDTFEELHEVQYLTEEQVLEEVEQIQEEEYLIDEEDHNFDCPSPSSNSKGKNEDFSCFDCNQTFTLKTHLINHRRKMHPKMKKFSCPTCPKVMYSKESLEVHLNLHNGLPAYQCDICEKTFKQKAHYNYHMLNHRNERNIICDVCQKRFISKSDLKIHLRVHTNERRYKCDICEKTFKAHTHMVNHRYSHFEKQFECPVCFQKYVSPNTLRTHFKAVHMGEVPFECEFCEKKFKRKHHLHAHYKTHSKMVETIKREPSVDL